MFFICYSVNQSIIYSFHALYSAYMLIQLYINSFNGSFNFSFIKVLSLKRY